jgi:hypothetical protein
MAFYLLHRSLHERKIRIGRSRITIRSAGKGLSERIDDELPRIAIFAPR